jgi:hypothetical protein
MDGSLRGAVMVKVRASSRIIGVILMFGGLTSPVHSQIRGLNGGNIFSAADDDSVTGRARPEYDAQGIPVGGFRAYPNLSVGASFDDNVLRAESDPKSDYFFQFSPQLNLRSQWSRHYLGIGAQATRYQYSTLSSENRTEWDVAGAGRADILTGVDLSVNGRYDSTFEARTSRDQIGAAEPTPYQHSDVGVVFSYDPYRLGLQVSAGFQRYNFDDTKLLSSFGGGLLDNDDRDRDVYSIATTALYELSPGYGLFFRPEYEKREYDLQTGRAAGRDSQGYKIDGGLNLLLGGLIRGEAYAGYVNQNFQGIQFSDVSGIDYGAALRWFPSQLITVHLNAARTLNATTLVGASVSDERSVELGADYELRRNIILQASVSYIAARFEGITRHDEDSSAQLGISYLLNPYVSADAKFTHTNRTTTERGFAFADNVVSITLSGHL